MQASWTPITKPIRLLTVTASGLTDTAQAQTSLFSGPRGADEADPRLDRVMDTLRGRFGQDALSFGSLVQKPNKPQDK